MKITGRIVCLIIASAMFFSEIHGFCDGINRIENMYANAETSAEKFGEISAESICVRECGTGSILYEKNSDKKMSASHCAKLMTLFIAAQEISAGKLSLNEMCTVSEKANLQPPPQIWLEKGERISVEELVKSITVGNSNDGCVALAEKIAGSEEKFVRLMNDKAKETGMKNTCFADCTGINEKSVTSARDMTLLCGKLFDFDFLKKYMNCWLDTVRQGKAELVNQNRLVRFYNGINGFKFWGKSGCAGAVRGKMKICAVVFNCKNEEERDVQIRKLLDTSFESYRLYSPEIPQDFTKKFSVTGGEENSVEAVLDKIPSAALPAEKIREIKCAAQREEILEAPVKKGQIVGEISCTLDEKEILSVKLRAKNDVDRMNVPCGLKKLWLNLLNLK